MHFYKNMHSGTSTIWGGGSRIPVQGNSFIDFLVQVKACCPLLQSSQSNCLVYHVFSCICQVKLKLFRSTEKDTEELLNLASRPRISGKGDKNRALKKCSTKQLLPSNSTSALGLHLLGKSHLNEASTQRTPPVGDWLFWTEVHLSYQILSGMLWLERSKVKAWKSLELTAEALIVSFAEFTIHIARKAYSVLLVTFYNPPQRGLT